MCTIRPGRVGFCRARKNVEGLLYSTIYGEYTSLALDPIEKKPLYHFHPGFTVLSIGTRGCNLRCGFCQNWQISQEDAPTDHISPEELAGEAKIREKTHRCIGIAYTYSEPLVWYEFVLDTSKLVHERGLKNVLVTNGEINEEPIEQLLPYIDAMNIDVKSFRNSYYMKVCGGKLPPVLRTAELVKKGGCHIEITNLVVPTLNDSPEEIRELVDWVASLGVETPLHFSRYSPNYRMDVPPTPVGTLKKAKEIADRKLRYVYIGNVWDEEGNDTRCYQCGNVVIRRRGFGIMDYKVVDGKCFNCGAKIDLEVGN